MPLTFKTQRTSRFVNLWSYLALGSAGLVLFIEPEESVELVVREFWVLSQ